MIKGLIFDMDGLILDTEKLYNIFWKKACADFGYVLSDEAALTLRSLSGENARKRFFELFGDRFDYFAVREHRIKLMDKYIDTNGVELKPGATEFLSAAREKGYRLSTATTSPFKRTERLLKSAELFDYFDEFACGDMVANSKPAPDIYILAAEKLGLRTHECMGFEDSPSGVKAMLSAGVKAVMIPDLSEPDERLKNKLYAFRTSLFDALNLL